MNITDLEASKLQTKTQCQVWLWLWISQLYYKLTVKAVIFIKTFLTLCFQSPTGHTPTHFLLDSHVSTILPFCPLHSLAQGLCQVLEDLCPRISSNQFPTNQGVKEGRKSGISRVVLILRRFMVSRPFGQLSVWDLAVFVLRR